MATALIMPKQGQSVETCAIVSWKKKVGDAVKTGEVVCEVETDKATFEVESPATGTLLAIFHEAGTQVPVLEAIAAIGSAGEEVSGLRGGTAAAAPSAPVAGPSSVSPAPSPVAAAASPSHVAPMSNEAPASGEPTARADSAAPSAASPRARALAAAKGIQLDGIAGTGPGGRIIERDVLSALEGRQPLTPAARGKAASLGRASVPAAGTGIGGRVRADDVAAAKTASAAPPAAAAGERRAATGRFTDVAVKGVRKIIADRMLASLATTAQLTMTASAPARHLLDLRRLFKESPTELGISGVTINDLVHLAVVRTLLSHPELNATFDGATIRRYDDVHLAFATDTPRGLLVPVIRNAQTLTLRQLAAEAARLATACREGGVKPDELAGGTFTVTNLGALGIQSFTPVLNVPQVAILGVGAIRPEPVQNGERIVFPSRIGLSLTINHQVVDGAPGARFLQALSDAFAGLTALLVE